MRYFLNNLNNIILVQGFCPLEVEIFQFSDGFSLNNTFTSAI